MLKYSKSMCMNRWEIVKDRRTQKPKTFSRESCASLCFESGDCAIFGYGSGAKSKQCALGSTSCESREKSSSLPWNVYKLVGRDSSTFKWIAKYAKCSQSAQNLGRQRGESVLSSKMCAAACMREFSSTYFSWDEYLSPSKWINADGINQRCRCYPKESQCVIINRCDPPETKTPEDARNYCKMKGLPTTSIGFILESVDDQVSALPCPAISTFLTSSLPAMSIHKATEASHCFDICREQDDCRFINYDSKARSCLLLAGSITSITARVGWISGSRNCAKKLGVNPNALYFAEEEFI